MINKTPFISVIIPVFNGEEYLAEAVESINRQHYKPHEIIIIDDGSTDSTADIATRQSGSVRYMYQSNSGPAAARNRGLKMARGDVIGFLDVDDLWDENKLKIQLGHLERNREKEIVLGFLQRMQLTGTKDGAPRFKEWSEPDMNMHLGSALFRREVFDRVGYLDESLGYCEDWDWFMRAKEKRVSILVHQDVVYYYRRHDHNITNDSDRNFNSALKMLRQSLNRRRQSNGTTSKLPRLSDLMSGSRKPCNRKASVRKDSENTDE